MGRGAPKLGSGDQWDQFYPRQHESSGYLEVRRGKVMEEEAANGKKRGAFAHCVLEVFRKGRAPNLKGTSCHVKLKKKNCGHFDLGGISSLFRFLITFLHFGAHRIVDFQVWWQCHILVRAWSQLAGEATSCLSCLCVCDHIMQLCRSSDFLFIKHGSGHLFSRFAVRLK